MKRLRRLWVVTIASLAAGAWAAEPTALNVPLHAGATLESALSLLNARGYRIVYSSALVQPGMTLAAAPKSTGIEELLREILAPWKLHAVHATNGDWLIVSDTLPATTATEDIVDEPVENIETIDVTASRTRLATTGASETFLAREDVQRMPHLADDAVRMLKVLPGVTGGDFSAALNIRGGRREEALLTVDGAEIHNGFHFRDIDGALSVLDTNLVQGIDFITGGMTAEYGDYMSGVVGLQTRRPSPDDEYRSGVGISFVSAYGRTSGTFAGDRGSWLLSARRGFLDVLTERVVPDDETLTPRYTDVFGAVNFALGDRSSLAARVLMSDDDLKFITDDDADDIDSAGTGHSTHLWFGFDHGWTEALQMNTLLAIATVNQKRDADGTDDERRSDMRSDSDFRFLDLKQDWSWRLNDRHLPRWGFNVNRQDGEYDYALVSRITDPLVSPVPIDIAYATDMDVRVNKLGAYASWRSRFTESVTAEAGLRWDSYEYPDDLKFDVVSPRLNFVYDFGLANEWRAAWSVVYQPQAANELQVEDNVTEFFEPERSEQFVIGYTRRFGRGLSLRVDVYDKNYSHLRTRFENLLDPIQIIPEGSADRIRIDAPEARARGVELALRREAERGLSGWVSLSIAEAREKVEGDWQSRSWEQQRTLAFGSSWTGAKWNVSLAGLFHSGTPTTFIGIESTPLPGGGIAVEGVVGERNAEHMAAYTRVDLRANRDVQLRNSKLSLYLEVTNLLNSKNECCIANYHLEQDRNGRLILDSETGYWLPMLPSFGIQWEF
ncbi:MAG TPA: TonB-dependent receptor [Steroidobacteraceae bacterium]|nr:TonB-dependent receptor [Steroidobacteraceae bacterium]